MDGRVFISYSRKDGVEYARELRNNLEAEGLSVWQDLAALEGGRDWWAQVEETLRAPSLQHFVLVLSERSLQSPVVRREIRLARQEGKLVSPVLGPGIGKRSTLPRWVGQIYDLDVEEHWDTLLRVLKLPSKQPRVPMMAPEPPEDFVARPVEFEKLKSALLNAKGDSVAITAALRGAGGYGKTTLARALAHDPDIQDAYFDGVLWVELGESPNNILSQVNDLVTRLTGAPPRLETVTAASAALSEALGDRRVLIVVDDLWRAQDLKPFLQGGANATRLVTTRLDDVVPANSYRQRVDRMGHTEALQLLCAGFDEKTTAPHRAALQAMASRLGEWALLLKIVNGFMRQRAERMNQAFEITLAGVERRLTARGLTGFDPSIPGERAMAVSRTIGVSLELLGEEHAKRLAELAVFPEDTDIPAALVELLWAKRGGLDDLDSEELMVQLAGLSLLLDLDLQRNTLRLHDTIRAFFRERMGDAKITEVAIAIAEILDELPLDRLGNTALQTYFFDHLLDHLAEAGRQDAIDVRLLSPAWLQSKLDATRNAVSLADDYARHGHTRFFNYVGRAIRLSAGVCTRDGRQLMSQLIGRLLASAETEAPEFLRRARELAPRPSLVHSAAALTPPGAEVTRLEGHKGSVNVLTRLSDGRIASGSNDNTVRIWHANSGEELHRLEGHTGRINALLELAEGSLVSASNDHTIRMWDTRAGRAVACGAYHSNWANVLVALGDGGFASGSNDHSIGVWNADGSERIRLHGHSQWISALAVSPTGLIASGAGDGEVRIWNGRDADCVACLAGDSRRRVTALRALSDDRFVVGYKDGDLCFWDPATNDARLVKAHARNVNALELGLNEVILSAGEDANIALWSPEGVEIRRFAARTSVRVISVLDGGRFATGGADGVVRLWDSDSGLELARLEGHSAVIQDVVRLGHDRLASASGDHTVRVWDIGVGAEDALALGETIEPVTCLTSLSDGRVVTASSETLRVWTKTGERQCVHSLDEIGRVYELGDAREGRVAAACDDGAIRIIQCDTGLVVRTLDGHGKRIRAMTTLPHGLLASGGDDNCIRVWDPSLGELISEMIWNEARLRSLTALSDERIVSGFADNSVCIWNWRSNERVFELALDGAGDVRQTEPEAISFSALIAQVLGAADRQAARLVEGPGCDAMTALGADTLVVAAPDNALAILRLPSAEVIRLFGHERKVRTLASFEAGRCVSGANDFSLRVWDVRRGLELAALDLDAGVVKVEVLANDRLVACDALGRLHWLELVSENA